MLRPRTSARPLALALALSTSAGCIVLDGFDDLSPRGAGGGDATTSTGDVATTGGGDGGSGTTFAATASSGSGGGEGGGGGTGPLEREAVLRFGANGDETCRTEITDVLRLDELTVVAGVTSAESGECEIVPFHDQGSTDFGGDAGGRVLWVAVLEDDGTPQRVLRLGYTDELSLSISGLDVDVAPVRLHRVAGQPGPLVTYSLQTVGASDGPVVQAELVVELLDPVTFDAVELARLVASNVAGLAGEVHALATEVVAGDAGELVVVGTVDAPDPLALTIGEDDLPCDVNAPSTFPVGSFGWLVGGDGACPFARLPGAAAWSAVRSGDALVALNAPFGATGPCDFEETGDTQVMRAPVEDPGTCTAVVARYPAPPEATPFATLLAAADLDVAIAARTREAGASGPAVVRFDRFAPGGGPGSERELDATGVVDVARLRAAGDHVVLGGWFGGALRFAGDEVGTSDRLDGYVLLSGGTPAEEVVVSLGGDGDDRVTSVDVQADDGGPRVVVAGAYEATNVRLDLEPPVAAQAGYVAVFSWR